jgi:phosphoribosylglycinamide formyltransferase-1
MDKHKITFLVSGNGGTLKFLCFAIEELNIPFEVNAVIADRNCEALEFAKGRSKIQTNRVSYSRSAPQELQGLLRDIQPDVVITNLHKIIDADTLNLLPNCFINLHYSLLPAYGGLIGMATIDEAKKAKARFIGATCHRVDELVDHGEIICQTAIAVEWDKMDTIGLRNTIFQAACICLLSGLQNTLQGSTGKAASIRILNQEVWLNPGPMFDTERLQETFWNRIKQA